MLLSYPELKGRLKNYFALGCSLWGLYEQIIKV